METDAAFADMDLVISSTGEVQLLFCLHGLTDVMITVQDHILLSMQRVPFFV